MPKNSLENLRHSLSHLLGAAVLKLYPGSKLAIGPAIENGFYYDIDVARKISDTDLPRMEAEMRKILKIWDKFEGHRVSADEARKLFKGNPYKEELISELKNKGEKITIYTSGDFTDLCRGGHVESTKDIDAEAFKLSHVAGAYWHGDEKNPQLTRIYGFAFETKKKLDDHLVMLEEAKNRDHKKLGPELDLFTFSDLVGSGLPLWTPKGTLLRDLLDNFVWKLRKEADYERVDIPHLAKKDLYEKSGHWEKFGNELFKVTTREGHLFVIKPMNCPHHAQIYARKPHSYRGLPQRYASTTKVYRDEQTGELSGLSRVRAITQDDAHVFCRKSQVKDEIMKIWNIINTFYKAACFNLSVQLSLHDPAQSAKYLGSKEVWQEMEDQLRLAVKQKMASSTNSEQTKVEEAIGEAAFYGPKIDFLANDSLGRKWQVATIQLDMNMPECFDLSCVNEKGEKERIVMIHAAIMGSIERYISVLIEHFAGAFPVWLSPVQAIVLSITEKQNKWAENVYEKLKKSGIRTEVNFDNETLGKKIRQAELQKVPYILVVGEKEVKNKAVAVRQRSKGDIGQMKVEKFTEKIKTEVEKKT